MDIVFMGTPAFAVAPLQALLEEGFRIKAVVTVPDKPAGRGRQLQMSPVKQFAISRHLQVLQPEVLSSENFIQTLRAIKPDLIVVVAFRKLPEAVWQLPVLGTFNLHASLLPDYRGAAPIQRAVMNGETRSGLTTFFINAGIDTGKIILRENMSIGPEETAGSLHDRMMVQGAGLVVKTVRLIESGNFPSLDQLTLLPAGRPLRAAPKIMKQDCKILWDRTAESVFNHIRGLNPYPAAYTEIQSPQMETFGLKVYIASIGAETKEPAGTIFTDGRNELRIACADRWLSLIEVQLEGKKRMDVASFLRGFPIKGKWHAI
jgi:methionyl-tRNA formyltransferase